MSRKMLTKPELRLIGANGNAYALLGLAMRVAQKEKMDWKAIKKEATAGDYNHLLRVLMTYFEVV